MDEQRLREIVVLANTKLPSIGPVPQAPELLKQVNQALREVLADGCQPRALIESLRYLKQEAQNTISFVAYLTIENDDEGDRPPDGGDPAAGDDIFDFAIHSLHERYPDDGDTTESEPPPFEDGMAF